MVLFGKPLLSLCVVDMFAANYSESWVDQKKFTFKALRSLGFGTKISENMIQSEIIEMLTCVEKQGSQAFSLQSHVQKVVLNVICTILYNERYEMEDEELTFLMKAVNDMKELLAEDVMNILMIPTWVRNITNPSGTKADITAFKSMVTLVKKKIIEHREQLKPGDPPRDFIDIYLQEMDMNNNHFSDERLAATTAIFMPDIGTVSEQIRCTLFYICLWDKVQSKMQAEIDAVCGMQMPSLDHRAQLPYSEAAILETMRLANIVPITFTHRTVNGPKTFRGYNIPEDAEIYGNLYGVHMNPDVFPEPKVFNPHRFLNEEGELVKSDKVIPFGIGK